MDKRPNSKVNLDRAIQRIYGTGAKYVEIRSMIANTIVGQFLPEGVVKGGSALRLRYGLENTRVTVDFDTLQDDTVTLRLRDTMEQKRVKISELRSIIEDEVTITSLLKKLKQ